MEIKTSAGQGFTVPDDLQMESTTHDALLGFTVTSVEPGIGPEGITTLYGFYPALGPQQRYAIGIGYEEDDPDKPAGLQYWRAAI